MIGARQFNRQSVLSFLFTVAAILPLIVLSAPAGAQTYQPTPEQMRMINQLPPAQRQQAMQALEQLNRQGGGSQQQPGKLSEQLSPMPSQDADEQPEPDTMPVEPKTEGGTRLIIDLEPDFELTAMELQKLREDPALQRIEGSHYYELDEDGVLELPGVANIPLLGLTAEAIERRLGAETALKSFDIAVSILEQKSFGAEALQPFGYDLFRPAEVGFEPVTSGPVPPNYILGPGDTVRVQLFGNVNRTDELEVTRDGQLNLPELGPLTVAGLHFSEFRDDLSRRVKETLIGTQVSVSMGQLRTIRIFVMGDVERPGSYVVSSLATISSGLYYSGGISEIGSLRDVQLKRQGKQVVTLDLYDFLLHGDTSDDYRLQPGDVIFVPPLGPTVGVSGAVRRPAIYEIDDEKTVDDVIELAGGLLPEAYADAARIERINDDKERIVVSVVADGRTAASTRVLAGDTIIVPEVLQEFSKSVMLAGHVQRPGPYELKDGMRLTDLIPSALHLKLGADTNYVLLRREDPKTRRIHVESASLDAVWEEPASAANVRLQARDTVHVFNNAFGRQRVIEPILEELKLQSRYTEPHRVVEISGQVRSPGRYPLEPGMRVSDLIRAGGDLSEAAYGVNAELTRYEVIDDQVRETEVVEINLDAILSGDVNADLSLVPHDFLKISVVPDWDSQWTVTLDGEVTFPGQYRIRRGETLGQVLARAGGLTSEAFLEGAIFLRESLREREQEQIDQLVRRLETDLTSLSLQSVETTGSETLTTGRALLQQLRDTEAVGRLVIDLHKLTDADRRESAYDIQLKDGDELLVPVQSQVVTLIGEVQQTTSHLYRQGLTRDDYLELSGGLTRRADRKLIYVVRASGAVVTGERSRWFSRAENTDIRPGDTIVIPLETDRIRPLTFWTNVSQIFYQSAIAIAAVRTFR